MSNAKSATFSVNVMVNKERTKVLFLEANRDFADVLLSFLTLPLGRILKLLGNEAIESLSTLYKSLAKMDNERFATKSAKQMLLYPRTSFAEERRNLKCELTEYRPTQFFSCSICCCNSYWLYEPIKCPTCGIWLQVDKLCSVPEACDSGCAFLGMKEASFFIFDDLRIMTSSTGFLQTIENFGVGDINGYELRNFTFGYHQIEELLKWSFISDSPLTDLILNNNTKTNPSSDLKQPKEGFLLNDQKIEKSEGGTSKSIILKVMMQKSTDKLLFAEADDEFVELLFSFLIIPLGGVESLLNSKTCLKSFDNLYRSLLEGIGDEYFATPSTKNRLLKPNLPLGYTSKDQFLPLCEDSPPEGISNLVSPKGPGNYLKKGNKFMVGDDLTVTNHYMSSGISFLNQLNIPLSDVYEVEVKIEMEEALSILRASLTSTSTLTHGLMMNKNFKMQPKQEQY